MLKDVSGFAEHQQKATYGLLYKVTPTKNKDGAVLHKVVALVESRVKIELIHYFVAQYTPSIQQQGFYSKHFFKTATDVRYVERSVFMKEVKHQNLRNFELGRHESVNVPIWIVRGIQQRERQH